MKVLNGEKAIISLTTWKKRIATVGKTIYSLLKQCPNYHIVLVLSEEEFPRKMDELPFDLKILYDSELFEIIWIKPNYRSFKKTFFTMRKYPNVPIISADDGQIYVKNFAEPLYALWKKYPTHIISKTHWLGSGAPGGSGASGILFPPNCFKNYGIEILEKYYKQLQKNPNDDRFLGCLSKALNIDWKFIDPPNIREYSSFVSLPEDEKNGMTRNHTYIKGTNWIFFDIIYKVVPKIFKKH